MVKRGLPLLVVVLAFVCSGCVTKPVVELHAARISSAAPQGVGIDIYVMVNNENVFDVKVRTLKLQVTIAEHFTLPNVEFNPDQWLGSEASTVVRVPVVVPWNLVPGLVAATVGSDTITYRAQGWADVTAVRSLGIQKNDYPLDEQGSVSRAALVTAALRGGVQVQY